MSTPEPARITRVVSPEAALVAALESSDGFPVPSMREFAGRVLEQLEALGYQVRPAARIWFQPAAHAGAVLWVRFDDRGMSASWTDSPNTPPTGEGWHLAYLRHEGER